MSIAVCCTLADGVVLGTDSAITIRGTRAGETQPRVLKVYNEADKLFGIHSDARSADRLPIGVVTFGLATLGNRTLQSFFREFELENDPAKLKKLSMKELAGKIHTFFRQRYTDYFRPALAAKGQKIEDMPVEARPALSMFLGGFSPGEPLPEAFQINVQGDEAPVQIRKSGDFGSNWGGQYDGVKRFHKGFDDRVMDAALQAAFQHAGVDTSKLDPNQLTAAVDAAVGHFEYQVPFAAMPLQEGIDYVRFLLEIAILQHRFVIGAPTCGGNVRLAVVRKYEGLEWVTPLKFTVRG